MSFEPEGHEDEDADLNLAVMANVFNFEREWKYGDPAQDELSHVLSKCFYADDEINFNIMACQFLRARNGACYDIWSGAQQAKNLRSLKKKIGEISNLYNALPGYLTDSLFSASSISPREKTDELRTDADKVADYLKKLWDRATPGLQGYSGLQILVKYSDALIPAFDEAIKETSIGVPIGNRKIEAWRLVEACDHICRFFPGVITPPDCLGNSGDFYRLVSDIFDLFGIYNDPVDMFKTWKKHVCRSEEKKP
jgi:hypothetical protein